LDSWCPSSVAMMAKKEGGKSDGDGCKDTVVFWNAKSGF
jgi:hypothetical protein